MPALHVVVAVLDNMLLKAVDDRRIWSGIIRDAVKGTPHHARALVAFDTVNQQIDALAMAIDALKEAT